MFGCSTRRYRERDVHALRGEDSGEEVNREVSLRVVFSLVWGDGLSSDGVSCKGYSLVLSPAFLSPRGKALHD